MTPSSWGWQSQSWQWWRHLRIDGNNAIVTRTTTASWWWRGGPRIHDDNYPIARRATMPTWGWQQHHCDEGNNVVCILRATPPLLQGQQHLLHNSKNACTLTMATPQSSWGWQSQLQQWQRHLRIDPSNSMPGTGLRRMQRRDCWQCLGPKMYTPHKKVNNTIGTMKIQLNIDHLKHPEQLERYAQIRKCIYWKSSWTIWKKIKNTNLIDQMIFFLVPTPWRRNRTDMVAQTENINCNRKMFIICSFLCLGPFSFPMHCKHLPRSYWIDLHWYQPSW